MTLSRNRLPLFASLAAVILSMACGTEPTLPVMTAGSIAAI
jgi:hypothetical protein